MALQNRINTSHRPCAYSPFSIFFRFSVSHRRCSTVTDIQCSFASQGSNLGDIITAKLKKPIGFKGAPLFADDRAVNPEADFACSIKQDRKDPSELSFDLKITDFTRCGVLKRNVRILSLAVRCCLVVVVSPQWPIFW